MQVKNFTAKNPENFNTATLKDATFCTIANAKAIENTATSSRFREILTDTPLFKTTSDDDGNLSGIYFLLPKTYYVEIVKSCTLDSGKIGFKVNYGDFSGFVRAESLSEEPSTISTTQIGTTITLYSDAGTYIRSTPEISNNRIRIIPQGTTDIIYIGSIIGDTPSDGTGNLWYMVEYNFGDTSTLLGYIYSERAILSQPLVDLKKPETSTPPATASPNTDNLTPTATTKKPTLNLSVSPALKWAIALLFIIPAIVIFLLLIKKPKRRVLDTPQPDPPFEPFSNSDKNNFTSTDFDILPEFAETSNFTNFSQKNDNISQISENFNQKKLKNKKISQNLQNNLKNPTSDNFDNIPSNNPSKFGNSTNNGNNPIAIEKISNLKNFSKNHQKRKKFSLNSQKALKFSRDFEPYVNFKTTLETAKELTPDTFSSPTTEFISTTPNNSATEYTSNTSPFPTKGITTDTHTNLNTFTNSTTEFSSSTLHFPTQNFPANTNTGSNTFTNSATEYASNTSPFPTKGITTDTHTNLNAFSNSATEFSSNAPHFPAQNFSADTNTRLNKEFSPDTSTDYSKNFSHNTSSGSNPQNLTLLSESPNFTKDFHHSTTTPSTSNIQPSKPQNSASFQNTTSNFNSTNINSANLNSASQYSDPKNSVSFQSDNPNIYTSNSPYNNTENKSSFPKPTRLENSYGEYFSDTQKLKKSIENADPISRPTFPKINIDETEYSEDFSISTPFSSVLGSTNNTPPFRNRFNKK